MTQREQIYRFLTKKRFAMIGVSRNASDFSRKLFQEFVGRGYQVIPVNPQSEEIAGVDCFHSIVDVQPPVECALLMVPRASAVRAAAECAEAGVRFVWFYGVRGEKDVDPEAVEFLAGKGINVITGHCPFMFLPDAGFIHRAHGTVWRWLGKYPH